MLVMIEAKDGVKQHQHIAKKNIAKMIKKYKDKIRVLK